MLAVFPALGLATRAQPAELAISSWLWLTGVELVASVDRRREVRCAVVAPELRLRLRDNVLAFPSVKPEVRAHADIPHHELEASWSVTHQG